MIAAHNFGVVHSELFMVDQLAGRRYSTPRRDTLRGEVDILGERIRQLDEEIDGPMA